MFYTVKKKMLFSAHHVNSHLHAETFLQTKQFCPFYAFFFKSLLPCRKSLAAGTDKTGIIAFQMWNKTVEITKASEPASSDVSLVKTEF